MKAAWIENYQQGGTYQQFRQSKNFKPEAEADVRGRFGLSPLPKPQPQQKKPLQPLGKQTSAPATKRSFIDSFKSAKSILKAKPGQSKKIAALKAASVAMPELAPVALAAEKLDKINIAKKASATMKAARGAMIHKYGIKAIFMPRFWILMVSGVTLKHPFVLAVVSIILAVFLMSYTFGGTSTVYELYFIKCAITFIPNIGTTILNAVWFGVHGLYFMALTGVLDFVNGVFGWFLSPIYIIINFIGSFGGLNSGWTTQSFSGIGNGVGIEIMPTQGFAYLAPSPIIVKYDSAGQPDILGTMGSMWDFRWMKPGVPMYGTDKVYFYSEHGALLYTPALNSNAMASGIWTSFPTTTTNAGVLQYTYNSLEMIAKWQQMFGITQPPSGTPVVQPPTSTTLYIPPSIMSNFIANSAGTGIAWIWNALGDWIFGPVPHIHLNLG